MRKSNSWIGDRYFYHKILIVAVPIMIQNGITNIVSLLDNYMVGQVGTEQMSGVAIVNQLIFVYNLCIYGAISGAGIFGAQFYGKGDHKGLRDVFRLKWMVGIILLGIGWLVLSLLGDNLIGLYLTGEGTTESAILSLHYGKEYLSLMLLGLIPFMISQNYASTLRETTETVQPMLASMLAVVVNVSLNYLLIFGQFGLPCMGVRGAALATVIARFVETAYLVIWTHLHAERNIFIQGAYRSFRLPPALTWEMIRTGFPLMLNETLWSAGIAFLAQCYSVRGLKVVAALNISNTIANLFNVGYIALGSAVAIIVGQLLGAGRLEEARITAWRMIAFSVASCILVGMILAMLAPFFPKIYQTTEDVRTLATQLIRIVALYMPVNAFVNACYFTLRSGGKTGITLLIACAFVWVVTLPLAFCLSRFTQLPILPLYFCCQAVDLIKCVIGFILVKKGIWIQNMVEDSVARS